MEEEFFFLYHLKVGRAAFLNYPIMIRKWMIERFIEQKEKENQAMEKAKKGKGR